jgi:kynurenine formamidase
LGRELPFGKIIDLSVPIKSQETHVYPGYPKPLRSTLSTVREDGYYSNIWTLDEHTGTHVDAPAHFFEDLPSIERVPLGVTVGKGVLLDFAERRANYSITRRDVEIGLKQKSQRGKVGRGWVILFHTGYTAKAGTQRWLEHPGLSEEACRFVVSLRVNAIGFDAPSPDRPPFPAHKILLPRGILIFEGLTNLEKVAGRDFIFFGLPLPLVEGSASPVRALAVLSD